MLRVFTPEDDIALERERPYKQSPPVEVFLAGGIPGCPDWQKEFIDKFREILYKDNVIIYNPRLPEFVDTSDKALQKQIKWEHEALGYAQFVVFWFPKESVCPTTLFELGHVLGRKDGPKIIVGVHPEYSHRRNIHYQLLYSEKTVGIIADTIDDLVEALDYYL